MKGTVWRRGAGGAALTLLLVFGLGCMNVTLIRTVEDLWFTELYHVTWIPWLVMGLAVIGCLALLGALRPLKVQSPWNYAPALVLGLILCIGTSSPLVWIEFDSSRWNVPYTLVFVYALFAVEFVRLLLRAEARATPFAWKEAAKLVGLLALAYLPLLVSELGRTIGDALSTARSLEPIHTANKFRLAFYFLGGALGFLAARRGRRGVPGRAGRGHARPGLSGLCDGSIRVAFGSPGALQPAAVGGDPAGAGVRWAELLRHHVGLWLCVLRGHQVPAAGKAVAGLIKEPVPG